MFTKTLLARNLFFILSIALINFLLISSINSADNATINATVTPENLSITVSDGTISYGVLPLSGTANTTITGINDSQTTTNTGNVAIDINIRGTNSANWTLAAVAGSDQYTHKFCSINCDTTPVWTALTTSNQTLSTAVSAAGNSNIDLQLGMPTASTNFTQQSVNVVVQAVAN
jgi:hypothetical protein